MGWRWRVPLKVGLDEETFLECGNYERGKKKSYIKCGAKECSKIILLDQKSWTEKRNYDSDCRIALFYREIITQPH